MRVCVPQPLQAWLWVAPGLQVPSPVQDPQEPQAQALVQVCDCVPQLPQPWLAEAPGEQTPSPAQDPHVQLDEQVWVPQLPQPCVAPGVQSPPPEQVPQEPHAQALVHVRDCVPQPPQSWLWVWPAVHSPSPVQVPQWPVASQVCVPQSPQSAVAPGVQSPSSTHSQSPHAQLSEHVLASWPAVPHVPPVSSPPRQHSKPSSHAPSQSSSAPLQTSGPEAQSAGGGRLQVAVHVPVPADPQDVVQLVSSPAAQGKPSSTVPSQSSSVPLHVSVPEGVQVSQPPSPSSSDQPGRHSDVHVPPSHAGRAILSGRCRVSPVSKVDPASITRTRIRHEGTRTR